MVWAIKGCDVVKRLFLLLVLCFSLNAYAIEGFYKYDQLPHEFHLTRDNYQKASSSVFKVEIGRGLVSKCSGQFISNEGHFLTALHCIDISAEVFDALDINPIKFGSLSYIEVNRTHPENYSFPKVRLYRNGRDFYVGPAQVVLLGKGFTKARPHYDLENGFDMNASERNKVVEFGEDYMIIKLPVTSNCLPLSQNELKQGDKLWGIGFPALANRSDYSSDGISEYITAGVFHESMRETPELARVPEEVVAEYDRTYITEVRKVTDMDAWSEMSGSLVINDKAQLVGITVGGLHQKDRYVHVGTEIVNAKYIKNRALELLGKEKSDEIFHCEN